MMWWNDGMGWGSGGWVVMALVMLALAVVVFMALFRSGRSNASTPGPARRSTSEQLLDERFARGEMDADEYQARRDVLRAAR